MLLHIVHCPLFKSLSHGEQLADMGTNACIKWQALHHRFPKQIFKYNLMWFELRYESVDTQSKSVAAIRVCGAVFIFSVHGLVCEHMVDSDSGGRSVGDMGVAGWQRGGCALALAFCLALTGISYLAFNNGMYMCVGMLRGSDLGHVAGDGRCQV